MAYHASVVSAAVTLLTVGVAPVRLRAPRRVHPSRNECALIVIPTPLAYGARLHVGSGFAHHFRFLIPFILTVHPAGDGWIVGTSIWVLVQPGHCSLFSVSAGRSMPASSMTRMRYSRYSNSEKSEFCGNPRNHGGKSSADPF